MAGKAVGLCREKCYDGMNAYTAGMVIPVTG